MKRYAVTGLVLILAACANKPAGGGPRATVVMRDGTSASGSVVESSASEIKLTADDGSTRTISMTLVRSVDYGAAPAPGVPAAPAAPAAPDAAQPDTAYDPQYHPAEEAVTSKTLVLAAGTHLPVRTEETIDSAKAADGQTFAARVTRDVHDAAGDVVVPRGANARIIIRSASKGGHIHGTSELVLDLESVAVAGRRYQLLTADIVEKGHQGIGINKRTGEFAGGGAAIGAIVGAIAGGGKGAAIGAGSGAGAGAVGEILTKGGSVKVPVESVLTFQLERALRVTAAQ